MVFCALSLTGIHRELYTLDPDRELAVMKMVGHWNFSAHDLSDDELIHAGFLILQHALNIPELEEWRLPAGKSQRQLDTCLGSARTRSLTSDF